MKYLLLILTSFFALLHPVSAQTDSFDVFTFHSPEFFIKTVLPSRIQFSMKNNDTSFCLITVYKSQPTKEKLPATVMVQWNEYVVKRMTKASKKPLQTLPEKQWDGWNTVLSIGNFYQNKKKCVVMLYTFQNKNVSACAVYALSDKLFKSPVESFSKNLHLPDKP